MADYKGAPVLKQLPATKENYNGKNMSGGRKAVFSQSREYKLLKLDGMARQWRMEPTTAEEN